MKIGMLTGIWYIADKATLMESLRRAAALGFHTVDIHGVFHGGPLHFDQAECRRTADEMQRLGLTARNYVLHPLTNPAAAEDAEQEANIAYLKRGFDYAAAWGVNQIMLNAGQWTYGIPRPVAWQRSVKFLRSICDAAAERGLFIAQEPEPYVWFLVNDLPSAQRMFADVDRDNFTLLVDLGHLALSRENPADLATVKERIIHAHFSDHQAMQHTNQVIGSGVTRTADYLAYLKQMDIDACMQRFGCDELVISFELGAPGDRIDDPDEWVRRSLEYVQQAAPFMTL